MILMYDTYVQVRTTELVGNRAYADTKYIGSGNNTDASLGHICQALAPVLHFKILLVAVKRSSITVQRKFHIIHMYLLATADKK